MSQVQNDLTQGSVTRQLIRYAVPVVTTSLLQAVYMLVDMLIVSHLLGPDGASAVTNGGQTMDVLTKVAIGLSNGGNILVGQYFGARDKENQEKTIGTFLTLFLLLGAGMSVAAFALSGPFMAFMGAPSLADATAYLSVSTWGLFFIYGYNCIASILRAVGNSKAALRFILVSTGINVVLDYLFVGPMGMGVAGAALATVLAQGMSFLQALLYLLRRREIFSFRPAYFRLLGSKVKLIFQVGVPCAVQMTVAGISWLSVTYLINDYGVVYSAANGFSSRIKDFSQMFISATSVAASSMIAQNLGAHRYDRAKQVMYTAMKMTLLMSLVLIAVMELGAPLFMRIFTTAPEEIAAGALNLRIEILGQVFYAVFLIYHSLMTGSGHTWWVFFSSFSNCILFRLILALVFNHLWGITGIYIACAVAPSISIPIGMYYTRLGHWRRSLAD